MKPSAKLYCYVKEKSRNFLLNDLISEPTVQQDETPQPPPLPLKGGCESEEAPPPGEQQKEESFFFTSFEPQPGQQVSFSEAPIFWSAANKVLHLIQIYS